MKKLFFSLLATCMLTLTANAQTKFVKMELPSFRQSPAGPSEILIYEVSFKGKSGRNETGQIRFTVPDSGNGLVSLDFSENILQSMSITPNYFISSSPALNEEGTSSQSLSECLDTCNKKFTTPEGVKIKGRGRCKTDCWFGAIDDALPAILTLIKIFAS